MNKKLLTLIGVMLIVILGFYSVISIQFLSTTNSTFYDTARDSYLRNTENTANLFFSKVDNSYDVFNKKAKEYQNDAQDYLSNNSGPFSNNIGTENIIQEITSFFESQNVYLNDFNAFGYISKKGFISGTDRYKVIFEDTSDNIVYNGYIEETDFNKISDQNRFFGLLINVYNIGEVVTPAEGVTFPEYFNNEVVIYSCEFTLGSERMSLFALTTLETFNRYVDDSFMNSDYQYFLAAEDGWIYSTNYEEGNALLLGNILARESDNKYDYYSELLHNDSIKTANLKLAGTNYFVTKGLVGLREGSNNHGMYLYVFIPSTILDKTFNHLLINAIFFMLIVVGICIAVSTIFAIIIWYSFESYKMTMFEMSFTKSYNFVIDRTGKIKYANMMFKKLNNTGLRNIYEMDFLSYEDFEIIPHNKKSAALKESGLVFSFPTKVKTSNKDDEIETKVFLRGSLIHSGKSTQIIGLECTTSHNEHSLINKLAFYNPVCNILNQNALEEKLSTIIQNISDYSELFLLIIDIKEFRNINSLFGYDFGNQVIIKFAELLQGQISKYPDDEDLLYSLGGDRFAILMKKKTDGDGVKKYAHQINELFSEPVEIGLNTIVLVPAVGSFFIDPNRVGFLSAKSIISDTILANKQAKEIMGEHYYLFDISLSRTVERDTIMQEDLKKALSNNEFEVYYQPQYDTEKKEVKGFECLIRWNNPKYRLESPLRYIKIAEKIGLIKDIGEFTLRESFKLVKELGAKRKCHIYVNVSPAQLLQAGFLASFIKLYDEYDITPDAIAIEITETFLMSNFTETVARLKYLREKGVPIYLDDFGTGYSSLLYLNELPIDYIKIDREFVKDLSTSKSSRTIVSKLISLANELNIKVIAEGVETDFQAQFLLKNGCSLIQGWLVSKAVVRNEVLKLFDFHEDVTVKKGS